VRRGQIYLIGAVASIGFLIMFTVIAFSFLRLQGGSASTDVLFKKGISALKSIASSGALEDYLNSGNDEPVRIILETILPPQTYYCLIIEGYNSIYNLESFEPESTIQYVYTSSFLNRTCIITLKLAVRK